MKTIPLTNSDFVATVSDEDWLEAALYTWCLITGYARTTTRPHEFLHTMIAKKLSIKNPDHKDRDKLNNQRDNLREATKTQNQANKEKQKNSSSKYKGVCWRKDRDKWSCEIRVKGQAFHLGFYALEEDAAKAYNKAAIHHFGEFAVLNEVE